MTTPPPTDFSEHVYAVKHGVQLPLRIWQCTNSDSHEVSNYADPMDSAFGISRSDAPRTAGRKPWLFWSHGGGFMGGSLVPAPWVLPAFQQWCHVVSYGYRLAPHAGIDDMMADGADAFDWCRANLPALLEDIDIDAYAVGGLSAGATLALFNARNLSPRPRVVLDAYAITDFGDSYFDPKFSGPGYDPGTVSGRYSEGELERAIADRNLANALTSLAGTNDPDAEPKSQVWYARLLEMFGQGTDKRALQQDVRVHVAATSRIMRVLTRRERFRDNDTWRAYATEASPISELDSEFPPTAVLHGACDRVVPVDQSVRLVKKLKELGVDVKDVYAEDGGHCFDFELTEPTFEAWGKYIEPIVTFVQEHLESGIAGEGAFGDRTPGPEAEEKAKTPTAAPVDIEQVTAAVKALELEQPAHPDQHVHWKDLEAEAVAADVQAVAASVPAVAVDTPAVPADVPAAVPAAEVKV